MWVICLFSFVVYRSATYAKSIFTFSQVRFFGETDDEACGRLREEERQRGGGGVGNEQGEVGQEVLFQ